MWSKLDYIHLNTVRAGLVEKASQYIYSGASIYINDFGLLKIEKADNPIIIVLDSNAFVKYNQQWNSVKVWRLMNVYSIKGYFD